ncbi:MAG: restriction endonuclease subunit R [Symploca sp. SIO2G7]|nr:restriction endonuclease subunit R [Symploca sp. SIO2G7]
MTTLQASNISLKEVHHLLGLQRQYNGSFEPLLSLEPLTEFEQQELRKIRGYFENYLDKNKASEGQVKLVAISPLLRLAGFFADGIEIKVEEGIARIEVQSENLLISGRFDILAINQEKSSKENQEFWVLVIESKESLASTIAGLPQLLTYAYSSLEHQPTVWGLVTNGASYQFIYMQQGKPPTYQYMPELNLLNDSSLMQLLQILKAICK